ncbi:beta-galactosidase 15 [Lactuca sativa]|uniref:beta-galactosidase 15 n=1 Tax=Lactuca sativa TaxID=4236 RepID=UPI001C68FDFF|nr:beta-galactosidase 15 [Lactuca sativa]
MMGLTTLLLFSLLLLHQCISIANATKVSHDGRAITIDGQRRLLICGSIHYPRSTPEMWPDLIKKAKEGGLDAIETYVFWNAHEPFRRQYDFSGNLDFIRFIKTIQDHGLYVVLRIGPYVCAEWNYGGFPLWLHNMRGIEELRTANTVYMKEMQNFTEKIVDMVKKEKLFASQGGPIILSQVENEYGNVMTSYGHAGKVYIDWCAKMADSLNIGVPWIMCQQNDAPKPMINTCNGWYCDEFTPNNPNSPKMWTENWTGWFKSWGGSDPFRTTEDIAYATARFFQYGGTFNNYYMYHGGTNFGRTAGGPLITTSYDYDAPLDEYGNFNQPKFGHLKELHDALHSMEKVLTHGNVSHTDMGNSVSASIYQSNDGTGCFLSNTNTTSDARVSFQGAIYDIPAWSVSVLPDCKNEVYNTAKVNTETWVIEKKANQTEQEPVPLKWAWRHENIDDTVIKGKGDKSASKLMDQKAANDVSDYLWYMTSVNIDENDPIWSDDMSLRVNCTGQVLHAYVNGEYIGREFVTYGIFHYVFEKKIKLKPGINQITLLSVTTGFQHYGPKFDMIANGVPGPVEIIGRKGDQTVITDLSSHEWSFKAGIKSIDQYNNLVKVDSSEWKTHELPTQRKMTWYKTTFKAPMGTDPVSLDLDGLGKGLAWVNGKSIGRYWPSNIAKSHNCSEKGCDYRGKYDNNKCVRACGQPTQRWYHVPRSFLVDGDQNELVLWEEFGGNPSSVNFQTVSVGKACGYAYENKTMEISCSNGRSITGVRFASFGDVQGSCGSFQKGSCEGRKINALDVLKKECIGKEKCVVAANEAVFGSVDCKGIRKRLVAEKQRPRS